jgi:hypothetical protein
MKQTFAKLIIASLVLTSACNVTVSGNQPTGSSPTPQPSSGSSFPDSLKNGLVLYLPFEGNANDLSTNANNGTVNGQVSFVTGKIGKAAALNGTDQGETSIQVKNSDKLSLKAPFTLSAWANSTVVEIPSFYPVITKGKEKEDYTMWLTKGGTDILLNWQTENEIWQHLENEDNVKINANQWIYMTVTYDGSKVNSYINGVLNKSSDFNKPIDKSGEDLYIGLSLPGGIENFKGMIDEVRIYDRVLSDSEINALYTQK